MVRVRIVITWIIMVVIMRWVWCFLFAGWVDPRFVSSMRWSIVHLRDLAIHSHTRFHFRLWIKSGFSASHFRRRGGPPRR